MVFEKRTVRKIFGTRWEEVTGGWRKLPKGFTKYYTPTNALIVYHILV